MTTSDALIAALRPHLPAYLAQQRWYAGPPGLSEADVTVVGTEPLCATGQGARRMHQVLVDVAGARYQLLVGERPSGEPADFLHGHADAILGHLEDAYLYDGTLDAELTRELLPIVSGGVEFSNRVRPVGAEQSNTSLIYDDRIILKVYRRLLLDGHNPDVEVTTALAAVGFAHVARPVGVWRRGGVDLAFAQEFLSGGTEGWAMALTSLRDFYQREDDDPGAAGGDFAMEAAALGRVTAQLHLAMAEAFGAAPMSGAAWAALVGSIADRLAAVDTGVDPRGLVERLAAVTDPGPAVRVHGDYHLGQVMRADGGWYVLDFEGEPARPRAERVAPASPYKDVTGMLRSFDYAARFVLVERGGDAGEESPAADAWAGHNRDAFLGGYLAEGGIDALLPPEPARPLVAAAYELDKALYELGYERAYRPSWEPIPLAAIRRIVTRLSG